MTESRYLTLVELGLEFSRPDEPARRTATYRERGKRIAVHYGIEIIPGGFVLREATDRIGRGSAA